MICGSKLTCYSKLSCKQAVGSLSWAREALISIKHVYIQSCHGISVEDFCIAFVLNGPLSFLFSITSHDRHSCQ